MKKFAFAVLIAAIAAIAASPAAAAKKKHKRMAAAQVASADVNVNSARFVRDAFPVFLPSWAIPIYLSAQQQQR